MIAKLQQWLRKVGLCHFVLHNSARDYDNLLSSILMLSVFKINYSISSNFLVSYLLNMRFHKCKPTLPAFTSFHLFILISAICITLQKSVAHAEKSAQSNSQTMSALWAGSRFSPYVIDSGIHNSIINYELLTKLILPS